MSALINNNSVVGSRIRRVPPNYNQASSTSATSQAYSGPSNLNLFITNLRFLDLDLRKDWPNITPLTFSARNAQQNQKNRIRCVEWALYQLFALLGPEEACSKLHPLFPPLEPLQSLNLRSALFRCLEQVKKNGSLGQDIVLRKSMLEECKGAKFEELLAVFSNLVLKRVLITRDLQKHLALAQRLAYKNLSYKAEKYILTTLIIAHKFSLRQHLEDKRELRDKYRKFSDFLGLMENRLEKQSNKFHKTIDDRAYLLHIPEKQHKELQDRAKIISENLNWMQDILSGDTSTRISPFLSPRFDCLWDQVERGIPYDPYEKGKLNLFEKLDFLLQEQHYRLAQWQEFEKIVEKARKSITKKKPDMISEDRIGIDLGFTRHQILQLGDNDLYQPYISRSNTLEEYNQLVHNLKLELDQVGNNKTQKHQSPSISRRSEEAEKPCIEEPGISLATYSRESEGLSFAHSKLHSLPNVIISKKAHCVEPSRSPTNSNDHTQELEDSHLSKETSKTGSKKSEPVVITKNYKDEGSFQPKDINCSTKLRIEKKTESDLAKKILESVWMSSPSPKKHAHSFSLAERTRISMTRTPLLQTSNSCYEKDTKESPLITEEKLPYAASSSPKSRLELEPHADLVQRTRNSMAGFEAAQKKAQIDRRRSIKEEKKKQRKNSSLHKVEEGSTYPSAIDMIKDDQDYESVFKSRPKIKTSPTLVPGSNWLTHEET